MEEILPDRPRGPKWPSGHMSWAFRGIEHFEAQTTSFLAEGLSRGEQLMFVVDDPNPSLWPSRLIRRGDLRVASTSEVYGPDRMANPVEQRATFAGALAEALENGYTGIRVAADNTSMVATPERLALWVEWESIADAFMQENPVTGLCGFDRERIDPEVISYLTGMHSTLVTVE